MVFILSNDIHKHIILHILCTTMPAQYLLVFNYFVKIERGSGVKDCLTSRKHSSGKRMIRRVYWTYFSIKGVHDRRTSKLSGCTRRFYR